MNREGRVQTVSISHILKRPDSLNFYYHDLLRQALKTASLLLPEQNPPAHHRE
jgi:hypothetical protein